MAKIRKRTWTTANGELHYIIGLKHPVKGSECAASVRQRRPIVFESSQKREFCLACEFSNDSSSDNS